MYRMIITLLNVLSMTERANVAPNNYNGKVTNEFGVQCTVLVYVLRCKKNRSEINNSLFFSHFQPIIKLVMIT